MLARRAAEPADDRADFVFDDQRRQVFVREALTRRASRIVRRGKPLQHFVVEEVRKRAVADVVKESRDAERLHHQALARHVVAARAQLLCERTVEMPCPEARFVHDPESV